MFLSSKSNPAAFSTINARSFHIIDTHNQRAIPIIENPKSHICNPSIPRNDIAHKTNIDATHFTYQSKVYLGVADL